MILEWRMLLRSSAFLPAMKPTMLCRFELSCAVAGYEVTQNSGMKQSVQTTSKKRAGQNGLLKASITCAAQALSLHADAKPLCSVH